MSVMLNGHVMRTGSLLVCYIKLALRIFNKRADGEAFLLANCKVPIISLSKKL